MVKKLVLPALALLFLLGVSVEAAEQYAVVEIGGMTCGFCAFAIKKSVSEVEGVKDVRTSFQQKKAWITLDEEVTDEAIVEAVQKAGSYEVKGISRKLAAD